jgi:hypothetical protein
MALTLNEGRRTKQLVFGKGNAKLNKRIYHISLPAGHSCPFAKDCLSKANRITGHITDGKETKFRCFSASEEAVYPSVRKVRWHNFELLRKRKNTKEMVSLITKSIPSKARIIRIHVGGDFFSQNYFNAWLEVAELNPHITFYAYTKSLPFWVSRINNIPSNFSLNASMGGKADIMIKEEDLKYARVVFTEQEAKNLDLELDHDDSHAIRNDGAPFALLLHGTQPPNSPASKAWQIIRRTVGGYS